MSCRRRWSGRSPTTRSLVIRETARADAAAIAVDAVAPMADRAAADEVGTDRAGAMTAAVVGMIAAGAADLPDVIREHNARAHRPGEANGEGRTGSSRRYCGQPVPADFGCLSRDFRANLLPVPRGLGAITTTRHVAPAALAIAARVIEHARAAGIRTAMDPRELHLHKRVGGGFDDRHEQSGKDVADGYEAPDEASV